jgi:hypothetical protein
VFRIEFYIFYSDHKVSSGESFGVERSTHGRRMQLKCYELRVWSIASRGNGFPSTGVYCSDFALVMQLHHKRYFAIEF